MILLIGESGSGKSSVQNYLYERYGIPKAVVTTTRPMRENEKNGVDYFFISEDEFVKGIFGNEFIEFSTYNGWYYGLSYGQFRNNCSYIATPKGMRAIKRNIERNNVMNISVTTVYLHVDRGTRLINLIRRDGDRNIDESIRRNISDVGQFDGITDEVDFISENIGMKESVKQIGDEIMNLMTKRREISLEEVRK